MIVRNIGINQADGPFSTALDLSSVSKIYETYTLNPNATQTITLPSPNVNLSGSTICFRRVGGTASFQILSASSNIYPIDSFTQTNILIDSNKYMVRVSCLKYGTGSTDYGWFVV